MPVRIPSLLAALSLSFSAFAVACNGAPADLRQWKASDHDHTVNPNAAQVQVSDAGSPAAAVGLDDVTIVAWQQNCTTCHGELGRGDGPQGQLLHAADLSRPDWQAAVTDEAIAATIREGRGRMPAFNLPEITVTHLVALVRMLNLNRMQRGAHPTASSGAAANAPPPAHTAAPSGSAGATAPKRVGR
ncbi:MAG TPA: c-type cytochrome [Polyangiaceae bacterium]|nr:c-type cytochrome [Polyangiaceae bacterium]